MPSEHPTPDFEQQPVEPTIEHTPSDLAGSVRSSSSAALPHQESPLPERVADYEILDEIARGGMGVVYRAKHEQLQRTVALKMILAGEFASDDAVRRFYNEAEATARLDHPHIMPIYDVGNHSGHHYFCMKLIEGGSLSERMDELRKDTRLGIEVLRKVADAVNYAHQRGILHRDLKPDNVLLTEDLEPVVTDFGLAKKVQGRSDITRTGAVIGTPSYMAPEQASGSNNITMLADVYSLGAILYQFLCGRPPFREESPVQTLLKVIHDDAPPPRSIDASVNSDLELICMKCLARDPQQRYATAGEVATDLQRWLDGEPISVKQEALSSLTVRWLRTNLRTLIATILIGLFGGTLVGVTGWAMFLSSVMQGPAQQYGRLTSESVPLMATSLNLPNWVENIGIYLFVAYMVLAGYLNGIIIKPKTRSDAFVVGSLTGGFVAVGAFLMIGGWASLMSNVILPSLSDIELLAKGVWSPSDQIVPAQDLLQVRYPSLQDIPVNERASVMLSKVHVDQFAGIPRGLLFGIILIFIFSVVPMILCTVFMFQLQQEKLGFWRTMFAYVEFSFIGCLAIVYFAVTVMAPMAGATGPRPTWPYLVFCFGSFAVALAVIYSRVSFRRRLPLHLLWVVAFLLMYAQIDKTGNAMTVANEHVAVGEFIQAADRLETRLKTRPQEWSMAALALILRCHTGDRDAFLRLRDNFMDTHCTHGTAGGLFWVIRLSLLQSIDDDVSDKAFQLADLGNEINYEEEEYQHYQRFWQGLVALRKGEYAAADVALEEITNNSTIDDHLRADAFALRALASAFRNETAAARQFIQSAKRTLPKPEDPDSNWHLRLIVDIHIAEAEAAITQRA